MTVALTHPLIDDYLRALGGAVRDLPRRERDELVAQVREHIDTALPADASEADVRNVLDGLGSPRDIAAAAGVRPPTARRGAREAFALVLLVLGIPPFIGWVVGLALLLWSPLWTARQKLLATLVWPGGWFGAFLFFFALPVGQQSRTACESSITNPVTRCTAATSSGPPGWVPIVVAVVFFTLPLVVATYLWREAGERGAA